MTSVKCIIAEDEPLAQKQIERLMQQYGKRRLDLIAVCSNGLEVINKLKEDSIDLIFLDLHMPETTGDALLELIPDVRIHGQNLPYIIITSSHDRSYSKLANTPLGGQIIDFLTKPVNEERFNKAVDKVIKHMPAGTLAVKRRWGNETRLIETAIELPCIICISSKGPVLTLRHLKNGALGYENANNIETFQTQSHTLTELEALLPRQMFFRIHSSHIVYRNAIAGMSTEFVFLKDKKQLSLARDRKEAFSNWYSNHV
jgi:two-component system, LytTR family, response regulator